MKKLYDVTVEFRVLVHAETEEYAQDEAERATRYGVTEPNSTDAREVTSWSMVEPNWRDAIPFGEDDDRTVGQIWEEQSGVRAEMPRQELEANGQKRMF